MTKGEALRQVLFVILLSAVAEPSPKTIPETVMAPGCEITARTALGPITIRAGEVTPASGEKIVHTWRGSIARPVSDRYPRTYLWDHCERSVELEARTVRWHGSLGVYFPGTGLHWVECEGIARAVVEEGQQHFDNVDQALAWIKDRSKQMAFVYRNDGLAVGWGTNKPVRKELSVEVWRLLIAGRKPTVLAGASDADVTTTCQ